MECEKVADGRVLSYPYVDLLMYIEELKGFKNTDSEKLSKVYSLVQKVYLYERVEFAAFLTDAAMDVATADWNFLKREFLNWTAPNEVKAFEILQDFIGSNKITSIYALEKHLHRIVELEQKLPSFIVAGYLYSLSEYAKDYLINKNAKCELPKIAEHIVNCIYKYQLEIIAAHKKCFDVNNKTLEEVRRIDSMKRKYTLYWRIQYKGDIK